MQLGVPEVPSELVDAFAASFAVVQQETARLWELAAAMQASVGTDAEEFVGDDLALVMNVHPQTGSAFCDKAIRAARLPGLIGAWKARELTDRHVAVVCDEVVRWAEDEGDQAAIVELALARTRAWVEARAGRTWPTPGELRKRIRTAAVLLDCTAPDNARRSAAERRTVDLYPSAVGEGTLAARGPEAQVVRMNDAIRARAEAMGRLPGDQRSLDERRFDACYELICVDADNTEPGDVSRVPSIDDEGNPVEVRPRGVALQVVAPYSVTVGGDLELAEIPGYGPILPSTARDLCAQAEAVQRIAVDAATGEVLGQTEVMHLGDLATTYFELLLAGTIVMRTQKAEDGYRPSTRLRQLVEMRDHTCTFPGCARPARRCDLDHRVPWPDGPTSEGNLHALCRHHHRAKQAYFKVTVDSETEDTCWTTPDGRTYRRPPPRW